MTYEKIQRLEYGYCIAPAIAAAGFTAAGMIGNTALNNWLTNKTNEQNLDYAMAVNKNKYQWAVEDAKKAGLSPLAVAGGSQSGQSFTAVAPQSDFNAGAVMDSYLSAQASDIEAEKLAFEKQKWKDTHPEQHDEFGESMENSLKVAEIAANASRENAKTAAEASKYSTDVAADTAAKSRESQEKMHSEDLVQRIYEYGKTSEESTRQFNELLKQNDKKAAADVALRSQGARIEEYRNLCQSLGVHVEIEYCSTVDEYEQALKVNSPLLEMFYSKYASLLEDNPELAYEQYSTSESDGKTISGGVNVGKNNGESHSENQSESFSKKVPKKTFGKIAESVAGGVMDSVTKGLNVGVNGQYSDNESNSFGYSQNERLKKECSRLLKECGYKFPILDTRY